MYRVPRATYRIQFNAGFRFDEAREIVPYLAELGISDIYASPILRARKGSGHGYDVVDASALNPELGTEEDFNALHAALRETQLGLLLDVVPNHMAASAENAWWMSVLENGEHSRFLHYFDIDWTPVTTRGQTVSKVLLPILGKPYGEALESREIQLHFDVDGFYFTYYDNRLPLAPASYGQVLRHCIESLPREGVAIELRELAEDDAATPNSKFLKETLWRIYEQEATFREALNDAMARINGRAGEAGSFNDLDALLDAQWYRLAYWRIASETINYRRFFDVTDLVGVRVENPEVFEARNRRTLALIAEGKVTGLRIDHIDGLHDPIGHMRKLQARLDGESNGGKGFYIVLEKILEHGEELPRDFPVSGTTGYDFLDSVNALFVDPGGLRELDRFYRAFTGVTESFDDICYERKKQIIRELFSGEMRTLGSQLGAVAMADRNARDFAPVDLTAALTEVTACMCVYRTYIRNGTIDAADEQSIRAAIAEARRRAGSTLDERLFTFLERVLLVDPPPYVIAERDHWLAFVMRWQQFTGRVMAKGVEDTAFYNYNRLISLNDVGGNPGRDGFDGIADFHARNVRMQNQWPHTMNATSTHDTKRSEDVRARINVLSEIGPQWERQVRRWSKRNTPSRKGIIDSNVELLIYQTLIGIWPLDIRELPAVRDRLKQYVEKAAREAKTQTSWIAPNHAYEEVLLGFCDAILSDATLCTELERFQKRTAFYGFLNALSQVVLKATAPGTPDFYQGTELWDFSLVDPDNRHAVDYQLRAAMLKKLQTSTSIDTLLRRWHDGRIKMFVTWKTLDARARHADLFRDGSYEPVEGLHNVCAFVRRHGDDAVLVVVPRLIAGLVKPGKFPIGEVWGEASLPVIGKWRNVFTGEEHSGPSLALRDVFARFPVAVLERR
ncbi:MAG TPA: malto-oligosyltrehalose synthase [Thermoanaerobaculia bacterium]|jgi:(1->4)-alpha-D-glucan 1-alpha-D-glucosylmutase|nr:malto-oligosyltrehalose synthase [Thermoanaerobaculia bacterium]